MVLLAARAIFLTEEPLGKFPLGGGAQVLYNKLSAEVPFRQEDSYMPNQTRPALELVRSGALLDTLEQAIGALN